jgi:hypothetical protein
VSRNYLAKRLAREQGIPYVEALRRVQTGVGGQPQDLLAEVKRQCWDLVGSTVAYRFGGGVVAGAHFADELGLPTPPRIEQMRIHVLDPDYATLTWTPIEVLAARPAVGAPSVQSGYVTVEARVGFRCVMKTSDPVSDPTLRFPDEYIDENHVLVSLERDVLLRWHTVLVDGADPDLVFAHGEPRTTTRAALAG